MAHIISRLESTILDNSEALPGIYNAPRGYSTLFTQFCGDALDSPIAAPPPFLDIHIRALRSANARAWRQAKEAIELCGGGVGGVTNDYLMSFRWRRSTIDPGAFNPFERLFNTTCHSLEFLLTSLLNVRPLPGWWDANARKNFLCFFRKFLKILVYLQVCSKFFLRQFFCICDRIWDRLKNLRLLFYLVFNFVIGNIVRW